MKKYKKTIFLSGPIRGIPREKGIAWRREIQKNLGEDYQVLHAYRGREEKETMPHYKGAVIRDLNDIERSDIVIVNDTFANASSIGTAMEVFYAFNLNKVVILFGNAHKEDYWLNYHSHMRVEKLEEACEVVVNLFSD